MNQTRGWLRVAGQMMAVVVSILLAFGIDAGWDARSERAAERSALADLRLEMKANRDLLARVVAGNDTSMTRLATFLGSSPDQLPHLFGDSALVYGRPSQELSVTPLTPLHVTLWAPYTYDPQVGALRNFLQRGGADSAAGREQRAAVANWDAQLADAREETAVLWDASRMVLGMLGTHLTDLTPAEGEPFTLDGVIRQDYVAFMSSVRDDEALMAAVVAKFQLQRTYTFSLRALLRSTVDLLTLIDGPA